MMTAKLKRDTAIQESRTQSLTPKHPPKQSDHVTMLMTRPGMTAGKRFVKTANGTEKHGYNAGFLFDVLSPQVVHDIYELSTLLSALEEQPSLLVIRGAPKDPTYVGASVRRLGSGDAGNFETPAEGRHWILIDIDKIEVPPNLSLAGDVIAVCEHLVSLLPMEFHEASYHWSLSSSAGMDDPSKVSMHLWYWLKSPIPDTALKAWAKNVNARAGYKLVDPALFQHVQAHYTASPTFEGLDDPFPTRSGLQKKRQDAVDLVIESPTRPPTDRKRLGADRAVQRSGNGSGFEHHLSLIGDHAGGDGYHGAIIAAVASYVGTHGADGTDVEFVYEVVSKAVLAADASHHDAAYVEHMASREHIVPAIESAIKKFGSQSPRGKTRIHKGIEPHFKSTPISVAEAMRQLAEIAAHGS